MALPRLVALAALLPAARPFYLPGVAPRTFRYGDKARGGVGNRDGPTTKFAATPKLLSRRELPSRRRR